MKNSLFYNLRSKINVKITGNNIERIIKRLKNNNVEILNIKYLKDSIIIKIYKKDYDTLLKLKTIYDIEIINYNGLYEVRNKLLNNKYIIISILICLILLYIVTNLIFSIEIITNDLDMKNIIERELKNNGVKKYNFKKSFNQLQRIKANILHKHKDKIEWIEIEVIGTKYIIRYEPRIENNEESNTSYRHIIAKKDAVIKDMYINKGQIIKSKNTYVKKGDIIVSGYVYLNNSIKDTVSSDGTVMGECWYTVTITYPFKYYEEKETGNKNNSIVIKLLDNEIELFNKFKNKKSKNITLLKNNILPIEIIYQKQKEITIINENNNEGEVIDKAINYSKKQINNKLKANEYINSYKVLNKEIYDDYVRLNIFYSVVENITDYLNIEKYENLIDE